MKGKGGMMKGMKGMPMMEKKKGPKKGPKKGGKKGKG